MGAGRRGRRGLRDGDAGGARRAQAPLGGGDDVVAVAAAVVDADDGAALAVRAAAPEALPGAPADPPAEPADLDPATGGATDGDLGADGDARPVADRRGRRPQAHVRGDVLRDGDAHRAGRAQGVGLGGDDVVAVPAAVVDAENGAALAVGEAGREVVPATARQRLPVPAGLDSAPGGAVHRDLRAHGDEAPGGHDVGRGPERDLGRLRRRLGGGGGGAGALVLAARRRGGGRRGSRRGGRGREPVQGPVPVPEPEQPPREVRASPGRPPAPTRGSRTRARRWRQR